MDFYITQLSGIIMNNLQYFLLGLTVMILLALIIFININVRLSRMNKRYETMMKGMEGVNIEGLLHAHIQEVRNAVSKVDQLDKACSNLDHLSKRCVQKVGIVRFNAFEDTGSDLSFAIALLDASDNGIILSSIFGRNDSRVYAKPIDAGQSNYFLTDEEKKALEQAKGKRY